MLIYLISKLSSDGKNSNIYCMSYKLYRAYSQDKVVRVGGANMQSSRPSAHYSLITHISRPETIPAVCRVHRLLVCKVCCAVFSISLHWLLSSAWKSSIRRFVITEKAPRRAFSWLQAATTAFTFKTLLRHYAKWALTPRSLNVKLGPRHNYHEGRSRRSRGLLRDYEPSDGTFWSSIVYTIVRSHSPPGGRGTALKKTNLIQHDDEANCPWKIDKILMI